FSYYVAHFGNYNEIYGSIGAVIAMLVWLWISSFLVLFGASWNAEVEARIITTPQGVKPLPSDDAVEEPDDIETPGLSNIS
ncbi:MAG: YhjD/YihY/BrkB family envelope integrity protein, partial [Roseobacter sp.]